MNGNVIKSKQNDKLLAVALFSSVLITGLFLNIYLRLASALHAVFAYDFIYFGSRSISLWMLLAFVLMVIFLMYIINFYHKEYLLKPLYLSAIVTLILSMLGMLASDLIWMVEILIKGNISATFNDLLKNYFAHEWWLYALFLLLIGILIYILQFFVNEETKPPKSKRYLLFTIPLISSLVTAPYIINAYLFINSSSKIFEPLNIESSGFFSVLYFLLISLFWVYILLKKKHGLPGKTLVNLASVSTISATIALFIPLFSYIFVSKAEILRNRLSLLAALKVFNKNVILGSKALFPIFLVLILSAILRYRFKKKQFDENKSTSGKFGSASWGSIKDLRSKNTFSPNNAVPIGVGDDGRLIYLPFANKLTLAPPGVGKTISSSIPILLDFNGPAFVFDVKGELWATTARYRSEVLGRKIILIDPFQVTKSPDFKIGKSEELQQDYKINPFDFIPTEEAIRDRMINAFAASFIVSEDSCSNSAKHFDENAKILIRGFIDHMMKSSSKVKPTLAGLYGLLSQNTEASQETFKAMSGLSGRAAAASNQISRVGDNERGSILSTSYRQIDWIGDSNMQRILSVSDFDLRDFLKGNMDIFVVIPEDQVKEQGRLMRMLLTLLMGIIVQAAPSELPKQKMLFLLDEVAQLGYSPDVEQCIEVLRARGVVVWTVFQSLSQIEMFKKPDLFKGVTLKQFFTLDDVPTMQWIQELGGKTTVVNKTLSTNKGDSRQKMQTFGGRVSQGLSESVQETASDLIQINEIREMAIDEQFIFSHGQKPIRCKKIIYHEHPYYAGKFDPNPIEEARRK